MQSPEQIAREKIDRLLTEAGWVLQDRDGFDRNAALGVAVREFSLPAGFCDYLLFVAGKAAGVIEARRDDLLRKRLVQEDLYTAAAFLNAPRTAVNDGAYAHMCELTSLKTFVTDFASYIAAVAARSLILQVVD